MEHSFALTALLLLLSVAFVLAVDPKPHCSSGDCGKGEKKDTDGRCIPCGNETFMTFTNHSCMSCYKCDEAKLEGELIRDKCTTRSDAIVVCKPEYFNTGANTPDSRECLKCGNCTHNESISRNCTANKNTLCRPNTATSTAVPDNESTSVRNDLSTIETANTENETIVSPTSNFINTVPPEAKGDISNTVIALSVVIPVAILVIAAVGIWYRCCRKRNGLSAMTPQRVNTDDTELGRINTRG